MTCAASHMAAPTTIISILGLEHSGTTLLARILNNHPSVIAMGGLKNVARFVSGELTCSCGRPHGDCVFWHAVDRNLAGGGHSLESIPPALRSGDRESVHRLFLAIRITSGKSLIVESSRHPDFLDFLPGSPDFRLAAVHVFKHPAAQAWSARTGGRSVFREMKHYRRRSREILRRLRDRDAALHLSHADFCTAPAAGLRRILATAGAEPAPRQLETWGGEELHMLGGNRMQTSRSSAIRHDEAWRVKLSAWHLLMVRLLAGGPYARNLSAARLSLAAAVNAR